MYTKYSWQDSAQKKSIDWDGQWRIEEHWAEGEILTFNKDNTYTEKGENDTQNDTFEYFPNRYMFVTYYTTDWGEENTIYTVVKITKDELYLNNNENFKINWNDLINGHVGCKLYIM